MKKSNQKSLGENPETPDAPVRPDRKVYDLPDLGLDDAYKVFILIRFLLGPNKMRRRHLESVSVRSTDDASASFVSSTASDRKGFVKGESVPLDRILVPFVRTKGTPPRRAVLTMPLQKAPRRRRQDEIWYKGGRGARVRDYIFPRGNPAGRRKKLAPQGFDNLRNVH